MWRRWPRSFSPTRAASTTAGGRKSQTRRCACCAAARVARQCSRLQSVMNTHHTSSRRRHPHHSHLPPEISAAVFASPMAGARTPSATIPTLETVELAHIRRVLDLCSRNRTMAAQYLRHHPRTLARKIGSGDGRRTTAVGDASTPPRTGAPTDAYLAADGPRTSDTRRRSSTHHVGDARLHETVRQGENFMPTWLGTRASR